MSKKLYIGNLSYEITSADLEQLFGQHGEVQEATVITDRETGRSRGFGFVTMQSDEEAQKAIDALNGNEFQGRQLTINEAHERPARGGGHGGPRGRRY